MAQDQLLGSSKTEGIVVHWRPTKFNGHQVSAKEPKNRRDGDIRREDPELLSKGPPACS
eukprot:SAG31_NODE_4185_length_3494_cov_1.707511_4_plen_59_part_00